LHDRADDVSEFPIVDYLSDRVPDIRITFDPDSIRQPNVLDNIFCNNSGGFQYLVAKQY